MNYFLRRGKKQNVFYFIVGDEGENFQLSANAYVRMWRQLLNLRKSMRGDDRWVTLVGVNYLILLIISFT